MQNQSVKKNSQRAFTVQNLLDALNAAKNKNAPIDIVNENGDYIAENDAILTIDEDADGAQVHIVVTEHLGL